MTMVPSSISGTISDVVPSTLSIPSVDYTSRDYASILNDLVNLIPTYLPEWTDRSPGDFGIVLMELFCYVGDIINFYSDRIANEAFLATAQQRQSVLNIASMLDYTPHGNTAATTTLQFTITNPSPPVLIPGPGDSGGPTLVTTNTNGASPITFQTTQSLWIYGDAVSGTINTTGTGLAYQQILLGTDGFPYMGGKPYPTYIWLGSVNQHVTVNGTPWTYVPPPPANTPPFAGQLWNAQVYTVINGNTVQFGNGLSGAGQGMAPAVGAAIVITYQPAAPGMYGGSVPAVHGNQVSNENVGTSSGTPAQTFTLYRTPVLDGSVIISVNEGGTNNVWQYFQRLVDSMATDMAYTTNTDANGIVSIIFGDNTNGRVPISGAQITASYVAGGGSSGNVATNTLVNVGIAIPGVLAVTNTAPALGGADAESIDHIRIHAPLSITAINRAVTLDDYAALILNIPQIAKAAASALYHNAVNLYIHPSGSFWPNTPAGLAALQSAVNNITPLITNSAMTGYLDTRKVATVSVAILGPQYNKNGILSLGYVPVNVSVGIQVLTQYKMTTVQQNVQSIIRNLFRFDGVDFGTRISLSSVYHAIQAVEGVDYVNISVLARNEAVPSAGDIVCAAYEIPQANTVTVTPSGGIP